MSKTLTLSEGQWKEHIAPTPEQLGALENLPGTIEGEGERLVILASLTPLASIEDASAAQAIYEAHMVEGASLVACDIQLPEGTGIINCRVDGEHRQIRF